MTFRIADITSSSDFVSRINSQRSRVSVLQEQLSTQKRINRPSDDPSGAEMVLNLRTSQTEIHQFQRNADTADQKLTAADDSMNGYQGILERLKTLAAQGLSDTTTPEARNAIATEIDSLRSRVLSVANGRNGDEYLYGGTRQNSPPFDPVTGIPAATPTGSQFIQIEPGGNAIAVGVTADSVFSDATSTIFADLTNAAAALRGTGNPVADKAALQNFNSRLGTYSGQVANARVIIGANMRSTEITKDALSSNFLSLDQRATDIEGADFAGTAIALTDAQRALDATLQVVAQGRKSLFDYLG
ncbi:MAG: flagellar hook-associated protein FlgL [Acidobacteriota bacterium]